MAFEIVCDKCASPVSVEATDSAVNCPHCGAQLSADQPTSETTDSALEGESDGPLDSDWVFDVPGVTISKAALQPLSGRSQEAETSQDTASEDKSAASSDATTSAEPGQQVAPPSPQESALPYEHVMSPQQDAPPAQQIALPSQQQTVPPSQQVVPPQQAPPPQQTAAPPSQVESQAESADADNATAPMTSGSESVSGGPFVDPMKTFLPPDSNQSWADLQDEAAGPSSEPMRVESVPASAPAPSPVATSTTVSASGPSRFWFILLLSYASAVTLACVYLLTRPTEKQLDPEKLESLPDVIPPMKKGKIVSWMIDEGAPMPLGHTLKLGQSQRFGSLRVTPLRVTREMLEFVHYQGGGRREQKAPIGPVLKLWLRFENVSADQEFSPLDGHLLFSTVPSRKDPGVFRANTFLCRAADKQKKGQKVLVYQHSLESEFDLKGQNLKRELAPGDVLETYVPTVPDGLESLTGDLIWRVHFRKGYNPTSFRGVTTLIEVVFRDSQVQDAAPGKATALL